VRPISGSVPHAAPHLVRIDRLIWVQGPGLLQEHLSDFGIRGIRDATIVDWTDGRALWFIKVSDALGASVVRNHIDIVSDTLTVSDVIALALGIATGFKDGFIGAFRETGPTGDTFISD
jgi:hypothetical protein